jgi:hypothetical protein
MNMNINIILLLIIIVNVCNACIDLKLTSKHLGTMQFVQIAIEDDTGLFIYLCNIFSYNSNDIFINTIISY